MRYNVILGRDFLNACNLNLDPYTLGMIAMRKPMEINKRSMYTENDSPEKSLENAIVSPNC